MTSIIKELARRGHAGAKALDAFNPDQARDEKGMWTGGAMPGASGSTERADFHDAAAAKHRQIALSTSGRVAIAHFKAEAAHAHAASLNRNAKPGINYQAHQASNRASSLSAEAHHGSRQSRQEAAEAAIEAQFNAGKTYEQLHGTSLLRPIAISQDPKTQAAIRSDVVRENQIARGNDPSRSVFRGSQLASEGRGLGGIGRERAARGAKAVSESAFRASREAKTPEEHRAAAALHEHARSLYPIGQQSQRHWAAMKEHEAKSRRSPTELSAAGHMPTRLR